MTLSGSCHCGTIQFEFTGPFIRFTNCHCPDCRKINGTAFSANIVGATNGFKISKGADQLSSYESSKGKFRMFCRNCGAHVYARMDYKPEVTIVRAGLIDDTQGLRPQNHIWVSAKADWDDITDSLPQFPEGFKG